MKQRVANCPACGGPVEFKLSTALVTICDFCHSVIARTDQRLEDHGKVAELVETNSPFERGMHGQFDRKSFEIVGRVQYRHPAGGIWNEWYLQFPGDRVRWLAEAQGKFYVTEEYPLDNPSILPEFSDLTPGKKLRFGDGKSFVVAETGTATAYSADGDIPWAFQPNAEHRFVDLNGPDRDFATIEYESTGPVLFMGREASLKEFKLPTDRGEMQVMPTANTSAVQLNCPHCAGPLTLHAPDQTLRVCCPNCESLLDCQSGKLQYLQTLTAKSQLVPVIPLGAVGTLADVEYTVIGLMERFVVSDGRKYPWLEYLLYQSSVGFRWLAWTTGHWSFVEAVPVSSIQEHGKSLKYAGRNFTLFSQGTAYVSYVIGEFYWRVNVGESVVTNDYIDPPNMITTEHSINDQGSEWNVSLGTYVQPEVVEAAFQLKEQRPAWGVGAIQPAPPAGNETAIWFLFAAILVGLDVLFYTGVVAPPVSQFHFFVALAAISIWPIFKALGRQQFEARRWQESDFSPYAESESSSEGDDDE